MADFRELAGQYMSSENANETDQIIASTAAAIHQSSADRDAVRRWVESVGPWVRKQDDEDIDLIAQAKGLRFLAETVVALPDNVFTAQQIEMLVAFFKSHMSLKTGVLEAMTALEKLANQPRCKAAQRVSIVDGIARLGDDFNMQTIPTRLKVYEVLLALLQNPVLRPRIQERLNDDSTLVTDLLNTFHLEKEPRTLIVCFNVQRELLKQFTLSEDNLKEIFESFSSFFPISLRRAPSVGDVTVEELKSALRGCFAASGNLASRSFPFLLDKLDHGDALIISVKLDVLKTLEACIDSYDQVEHDVVKYIPKIWSSLKYEVRNGESDEAIDATLQVFRAIARRLASHDTADARVNSCQDFCDLIYNDFKDDLQNLTYARKAFRTLNAIAGTSRRTYYREAPRILQATSKLASSDNLSSQLEAVTSMNELLQERVNGSTSWQDGNLDKEADLLETIISKYIAYYVTLLEKAVASQTRSPSLTVAAKLAMQGVATLAVLRRPSTNSTLLPAVGLDHRLRMATLLEQLCLTLDSVVTDNDGLGEAAVSSLGTVVRQTPESWEPLIDRVFASVKAVEASGKRETEASKKLMYRLALIGCSQLPAGERSVWYLSKLTASLLALLDSVSVTSSPYAAAIVGVHTAISTFKGALQVRDKSTQIRPTLQDELIEFDSGIEICQRAAEWSGDTSDTYSTYLLVSFSAVRHIYRSISSATTASVVSTTTRMPDGVLIQVIKIMTFVVSQLDAKLQTALQLDQHVFSLFATRQVPELGIDPSPQTQALSLAILQGLWPAAITERLVLSGAAYKLLTVEATATLQNSMANKTLLEIITVLANRYQVPMSQPGQDVPSVEDIARYWADTIEEAVLKGHGGEDTRGKNLIAAMLAVMAGFTTRQERSAESILAPLLPRLLQLDDGPADSSDRSANSTIGLFTARQLYVITKEGESLSKSNHALVKPFHRQWTYETIVRPLLHTALSRSTKARESTDLSQTNYRIAGVTLLRNLDFDQYEADRADATRLVLGTIAPVNKTPAADIHTALQTLRKILAASPKTVQEHLKSAVTACVAILERWLQPQPRSLTLPVLNALRLSLEVLYLLTNGLSVPQKEPYLQTVRDALDLATASSSRELRQAAHLAKSKWN